MKWKARKKQLDKLRAKHAGNPYMAAFPDLRSGKENLAPTSDRITRTPGKAGRPAPPANLIVDHFHKSGLQVVLRSEIPWMGGKKS